MLRPMSCLSKLTPVMISINAKLLCGNNATKVTTPAIARSIHLTSRTLADRRDLRTFRMNMPGKDEGTLGEKIIDIEKLSEQEGLFPDVNTPNRLFNGIPFKELPVVNIKVTRNNTIMTLTDFKGKVHIIKSCGTEGFKTAKKGTNVAAQTTAINLSSKVLGLGVRTVRVRVQGLGPGRMAAIKGLQLAGLEVVSITDNTHVSWDPPRPRKVRRV
ncbi:28S ribosomal protein S11, mitochondrial [Copidosoma floridanum]|uniref:28S ribosomal protein S11, mitochondrial n=1 Tax=Copidosoma floridanum TaxID=29053 RepID=UPI0006C95DDB|nr:28S ribosomal protein S11, mitochondrial [Copidosoma floridanum]